MNDSPPNWVNILEGREKSLEGWAYKTGSPIAPFGLDCLISESPVCDESRMSMVIPFGSGVRRDGVGDILEVGGIDLSRHKINPIVLFDHGKGSHKFCSWPIAKAEDDQTGEYTVNIDVVGKTASLNAFFYQGKSLPPGSPQTDQYEFGLLSEQLYDLAVKRFIRGGSIGYQVQAARELPPDYETGTPKGLHLLKVLMLEGSLVVLPANMDTVSKMLTGGKCCGKPLSPYLVKSLACYAPPRVAQLGWEPGRVEEKATPSPMPHLEEGDRVISNHRRLPVRNTGRTYELTQTLPPTSTEEEEDQLPRHIRTNPGTGYSEEHKFRRLSRNPQHQIQRRLMGLRYHAGFGHLKPHEIPNGILADKLEDMGLQDHAQWVRSLKCLPKKGTKATPSPMPHLEQGDRVVRRASRARGVFADEREVTGVTPRTNKSPTVHVSGSPRGTVEVSAEERDLRRVGRNPQHQTQRRLQSLRHHAGFGHLKPGEIPNGILADKLEDMGLPEHVHQWVRSQKDFSRKSKGIKGPRLQWLGQSHNLNKAKTPHGTYFLHHDENSGMLLYLPTGEQVARRIGDPGPPEILYNRAHEHHKLQYTGYRMPGSGQYMGRPGQNSLPTHKGKSCTVPVPLDEDLSETHVPPAEWVPGAGARVKSLRQKYGKGISRRQFLRAAGVGLVAGALSVGLGPVTPKKPQPPQKPSKLPPMQHGWGDSHIAERRHAAAEKLKVGGKYEEGEAGPDRISKTAQLSPEQVNRGSHIHGEDDPLMDAGATDPAGWGQYGEMGPRKDRVISREEYGDSFGRYYRNPKAPPVKGLRRSGKSLRLQYGCKAIPEEVNLPRLHNDPFELEGKRYIFSVLRHPEGHVFSFSRLTNTGENFELQHDSSPGHVLKLRQEILNRVHNIITRENPKTFSFSVGFKEPGRVRLYDRISRDIAHRHGRELHVEDDRKEDGGGTRNYRFERPEEQTGQKAYPKRKATGKPFQPGQDSRRRRGFSQEECQVGFQRAMQAHGHDPKYQDWLRAQVRGTGKKAIQHSMEPGSVVHRFGKYAVIYNPEQNAHYGESGPYHLIYRSGPRKIGYDRPPHRHRVIGSYRSAEEARQELYHHRERDEQAQEGERIQREYERTFGPGREEHGSRMRKMDLMIDQIPRGGRVKVGAKPQQREGQQLGNQEKPQHSSYPFSGYMGQPWLKSLQWSTHENFRGEPRSFHAHTEHGDYRAHPIYSKRGQDPTGYDVVYYQAGSSTPHPLGRHNSPDDVMGVVNEHHQKLTGDPLRRKRGWNRPKGSKPLRDTGVERKPPSTGITHGEGDAPGTYSRRTKPSLRGQGESSGPAYGLKSISLRQKYRKSKGQLPHRKGRVGNVGTKATPSPMSHLEVGDRVVVRSVPEFPVYRVRKVHPPHEGENPETGDPEFHYSRGVSTQSETGSHGGGTENYYRRVGRSSHQEAQRRQTAQKYNLIQLRQHTGMGPDTPHWALADKLEEMGHDHAASWVRGLKALPGVTKVGNRYFRQTSNEPGGKIKRPRRHEEGEDLGKVVFQQGAGRIHRSQSHGHFLISIQRKRRGGFTGVDVLEHDHPTYESARRSFDELSHIHPELREEGECGGKALMSSRPYRQPARRNVIHRSGPFYVTHDPAAHPSQQFMVHDHPTAPPLGNYSRRDQAISHAIRLHEGHQQARGTNRETSSKAPIRLLNRMSEMGLTRPASPRQVNSAPNLGLTHPRQQKGLRRGKALNWEAGAGHHPTHDKSHTAVTKHGGYVVFQNWDKDTNIPLTSYSGAYLPRVYPSKPREDFGPFSTPEEAKFALEAHHHELTSPKISKRKQSGKPETPLKPRGMGSRGEKPLPREGVNAGIESIQRKTLTHRNTGE